MRRQWTAAEVDYMRARYRIDGGPAVAKALGRTLLSVRGQYARDQDNDDDVRGDEVVDYGLQPQTMTLGPCDDPRPLWLVITAPGYTSRESQVGMRDANYRDDV